MNSNTLLVLVHGFCCRNYHMYKWRDGLKADFPCIAIADMPARSGSFADCLASLTATMNSANYRRYEQIYMVGHSMGGLLAREFLAQNKPANAAKLICVGTPHQGSLLADIALKIPLAGVFAPPLKALTAAAREKLTTPDIANLKIGAIIGNNNAHWQGKLFLSKDSDGLVESFSANPADACDTVTMNIAHVPMMYDRLVIDQIRHFLLHGSFVK